MFNNEFPPIGGGSGNATYFFLKEFINEPDFEIDLVTSSPDEKFTIEHFSPNIKIIKLDVNKKYPHYWRIIEILKWTWKAYWFSKNLFVENKYDISHCWGGWPSGILGYLFKKKCPYIVALRGSDVPGYNERLIILDKIFLPFVCREIWKSASCVTVNSLYLEKMAKNTYNKIEFKNIYNCVDSTIYKPSTIDDDINSTVCNILYVGRLVKRKGIIYLLKAFKEVHEEYNRCKLVIVGDGPERKFLENYCEKIQIKSNTSFLGKIEKNDIPLVYQKSHIFVLPSLEESLANAAIEAMACGLPIITTNTGTAEIINNNGFIVERENPEQIRQALLKYIKDRDLMVKHGQQSRKLVERMTWNNKTKEYIKIYNNYNKNIA
jgi:L-malate glycosyltransferase